ncbi:MAG: tetratricopeptide repeat protein, partial [Kiritimatiellia bacterium]
SPATYSLQFNLQAVDAADRMVEAGIFPPALVLLKLCRPVEEVREGLREVEGFLQRRLQALQSDGASAIDNLYTLVAVQGRLAQVQAEIQAAASADDYNEGLLYRVAQVLSQMGMLYESYWAYDRLLREFPGSEQAPLALFSTSAIAAELGLTERAVEKGQDLLERFPEFELAPETAFNLAYVYEQNQDIPQMLSVLEDAIRRGIVTRKESDKAHAFFLAGYANLFLDEFESAGEWFERVRKETPDSRYVVDAAYWSAYSLMFTDAYAEAVIRLKAFLSAYPRSRYTTDANFRLALAHFGAGDLEQAKLSTESFIRNHPDSALQGEAYNLLGDVCGGLGLLDEAIAAYGQVELFTAQPGQVHSAVFNAGRIMEADARWSQMAEHFERYLKRYGEEGFYTRAVYEIGKAFRNTGRTEAALALYWETFLRFGNDPAALGADMILADYVNEFQAEEVLGTVQARAEARRAAREKTASDPETRKALAAMSQEEREALAAAAKQAEQQQAEQDRIEAEAQAGQRVRARLRNEIQPPPWEGPFLTRNLRLSHALVREGDLSAAPNLISSRMVEAASPEILLWLADLLEKREQFPLAATAYRRILDDFEETAATVTAYVKLGALELQQGNLESAMMWFRSVYEKYPTGEWTGTAVMRMADILYLQEKYEEAARTYEEIVLVREWRGPLWPEALYKIGLCLLQRGEPEKAFAYFQRVYVLYARHSEWAAKAYLESGKCLETLQRQTEAAQTYTEMLANPALAGTAAGEQARQRLANLPPSVIRMANETPNS